MDGAVTVGIGGSGGSGGQAGDVDANVDVGFVSAGGEAARGVVAQSVGGGGGNGGINISGGLQADRDTDIPSLVFGMGGEGGAGNISGNVTLTQTGDVLVDGVNSIGVLAQSVAGGGGNGALNVSGSLAAGEGFAGVVGVGGSGGLGADAGNVVLTSDGAIDVSGVALAELDEAGDDFTRFGDRANGILAQSVGGGGGNGGANISGVATRGNPIALNVGASGGGGGDAGEVTVTRGMTDATLLRTRGDQANGLTAQSIGGGGGNAGLNLQFALSGVATDDEPVSAQITIGGAGGDPGNGMMEVAGAAGSVKPVPIGQLKGAKVEAYVWPTALDPSTVGFDEGSGILALAITAHPDFDDTPLYDENRDGDPANDGADWHSHWVVLVEADTCGAGLKVGDVSPGVDLLPATAPYFPIALDSPGMSPILDGRQARITVPVANAEAVAFDAVTAELQVNVNGEAPLLCVTGVHDVASGDLSLPGRIRAEQ